MKITTRAIIIFALITLPFLFNNSYAQCPTDYPIDCSSFCCTQGSPNCCELDGYQGCCPEGFPYCGYNNAGEIKCFQQPPTTTTISAVTTTTTPSSGGTGDYIAVINTAGGDKETTESSGTLPGVNPSIMKIYFISNDESPVSFWYDLVIQGPDDPALLAKTKELCELQKKFLKTESITTYRVPLKINQKNRYTS